MFKTQTSIYYMNKFKEVHLMYEDILYGGFYTVTGKNKRYFFIAGTDEKDNVVTGRVPKEEFYKWYKEIEN